MLKKIFLFVLIAGTLILSACGAPPVRQDQGQGFVPPEQSQPAGQNPTAANPPTENQPAAQNPSGASQSGSAGSYPIVDTNQITCYSDSAVIACPQEAQSFAGQDGNYQGLAPAYQDNSDGTVTDLNTGLMWLQSPDFNGDGTIDSQDKMTYDNAVSYADSFIFAGYDDWRLPNIKELYSLMDFNGMGKSGVGGYDTVPEDAVPYVDTAYFDFAYGDVAAGERYIDAQYWSSAQYVSVTMNGDQTVFGVNFADGRIKGYPVSVGRNVTAQYVRYVRGNAAYGANDFADNGNGTITDNATGLTWMQQDSGAFNVGIYGDGSLNWQESLAWCESLDYAGANDWRLPNAKELQSLVDYSRSPDTTNSAAIDPLFQSTYLPNGVNNEGEGNYPYYWSSTTHLDGAFVEARAVYVAFGEARGVMDGRLMDVHGAGTQRSDNKSGDLSQSSGPQAPQGDVESVYNYARCMRGGTAAYTSGYMGTSSSSGSQGQQPSQGEQGQPPQEAIDACANQSQNSACSFTSPNKTVTGTCTTIQSGQMACVPAGGARP